MTDANTLALEPRSTALLVMDFQTAIVDGFAPDKDALLARTAALLEGARGAGLKIIYVIVAFRPGYPEANPRNKTFEAIRGSGRAGGIDTLVLAGIATSGVVLSTVRHAADADYRLVVVSDCCADRDPEVHRVLLEKVLARQTTVTTAAEVLQSLRS